MSKPPYQVQILRLRRFKHWSVPGIAKHLSVEHGLVRRVLWPQACADPAAAELAPAAPPKELPRLGHPLREPIVQMYLCDRLPTHRIAYFLGVPQMVVRRVLRSAGSLLHDPPATRSGGFHD